MDIKEIYTEGIKKNENIIKQALLWTNQKWGTHANIILEIGKSQCKNFTIDSDNKQIFKNLLLYFSGFEGSVLDLNKGIMLIGGVGTGKTIIFNIFKEYTKTILRANSFQIYSTQEIIDNVEISGVKYLEKFGTIPERPITCYFDDIASSNEEINYYGTKTNVIEQLMSIRYSVFTRHSKLTHFSSNLYPDELKALYGPRIADRMKEMFNIVELNSESRRK